MCSPGLLHHLVLIWNKSFSFDCITIVIINTLYKLYNMCKKNTDASAVNILSLLKVVSDILRNRCLSLGCVQETRGFLVTSLLMAEKKSLCWGCSVIWWRYLVLSFWTLKSVGFGISLHSPEAPTPQQEYQSQETRQPVLLKSSKPFLVVVTSNLLKVS